MPCAALGVGRLLGAPAALGKPASVSICRAPLPPSSPFGPPAPVCATGVGNAPPPIPLMAGTHSRCRYARPFAVVPCLGQRSENVVHSSVSDRCDVLQDDVARSHQANDSEQFVEQARSAASQAGTLSGLADVLAGESTAHNVG